MQCHRPPYYHYNPSLTIIKPSTLTRRVSRGLVIADLLNPTSLLHKRYRVTELTRDQRIEIRALRKYQKLRYEDIASITGFTQQQVQRACSEDLPVTPRKRKYKGKIRTPEKQQLKEWIESSEENHYIPLYLLPSAVSPSL